TVLLLVGLGACHTAAAQLASERLADQQSRIMDEVVEEESQNGAYSEGLIRPLTSLALLFNERGDLRSATVTSERLMQVIRANEGLRSLDQAPWIRLLIDYAEKVHDFGTAWDLEQRLLDLARRNPLDLRSAQIFHDIGDKRLAMLSRYVAGEFPPQIIIGCYYRTISCTSGDRRGAIGAIIDEATQHYSYAVNALVANQQYSSDELRQLEVERLRNSYYRQLMGRHEYLDGADTLQRLQQYAADGSATTQDRVEVLV